LKKCRSRFERDPRKGPRLRLDPEAYRQLCHEVLQKMDGVANRAGVWRIFKSITSSGGAT
jgi:hypothetical protein